MPVGEDGHVKPLAQIEREIIAIALLHCGGHVTEAAKALRVGRSTLYRKLPVSGAG
jgi:DNA-binding NtrC family response regulator